MPLRWMNITAYNGQKAMTYAVNFCFFILIFKNVLKALPAIAVPSHQMHNIFLYIFVFFFVNIREIR